MFCVAVSTLTLQWNPAVYTLPLPVVYVIIALAVFHYEVHIPIKYNTQPVLVCSTVIYNM